MRFNFREWWAVVRKHPYADLTAIIFFLILGGGGLRWWVRPTVFVSVDGRLRKLHTQSKTVGEALQAGHITLNNEDLCVPPTATPITTRNTSVHITRVTIVPETLFERSQPKIYWRVNLKANLRPVVVERGFIQESTQTVRNVFYDGIKVSQKVLKRKAVRRPVYTLSLLDKNQQPAKVYNLAKCKKLVMRATGYYVGEKYVPSDTTYLGYKLRRGLVAVDPKVIPLRTRLYVKGYGYAYAADTGSRIKGNRIDLAVKGKKEEQEFNRQQMTVYILEQARGW
jgi:3D (Asp-Asp-Asp) domain-containing protein